MSPMPRQGFRPPEQPSNIQFSFEFYDTTGKYSMSGWTKSQIHTALVRLKELCAMTLAEFAVQRRQFHFYETAWEKTVENHVFPDQRVNTLDPFHFALVGVNGQKARVYGALAAGAVFYCVV